MAPGTTRSPQRAILLFLDNRWTEIAFKHVALALPFEIVEETISPNEPL
jgi:hypothetical protein